MVRAVKTFLPMLRRQRRVTHVHGLICFFSLETCLTAWKTCLLDMLSI